MNDQIVVHKLDENGVEVWQYPASVIEQTGTYIRVEAIFDRDRVSAGPLVLSRDDRFIETFYFDRWFNIFEVFERDHGPFKGWYCNICRPAWTEDDSLYAEDLALDLVVMPDGRHEVLDEEEFEQLEISEEDRVQALRALHNLESQAVDRSGFFAQPHSPK